MTYKQNGRARTLRLRLRVKRSVTQFCDVCDRTRIFDRQAANIYTCRACLSVSQFVVADRRPGGRRG